MSGEIFPSSGAKESTPDVYLCSKVNELASSAVSEGSPLTMTGGLFSLPCLFGSIKYSKALVAEPERLPEDAPVYFEISYNHWFIISLISFCCCMILVK